MAEGDYSAAIIGNTNLLNLLLIGLTALTARAKESCARNDFETTPSAPDAEIDRNVLDGRSTLTEQSSFSMKI